MIKRVLARLLQVDPPESDPDEREAFVAAREICRRHARSFYFASHFLPVAKRYAAYAVYAFCRLLDDAVDEAENDQNAFPKPLDGSEFPASGFSAAYPAAVEELKQIQLESAIARFTRALDAVYAGHLTLPSLADRTETDHALRAFELTVKRNGIDQRYFLDLAEGCRMDLTVSRYETWAELEIYCYRVAGVVGLMMCPIFGLARREAERQAVQMGHAMQLTNILRDVGEDWGRGRIYLPQEDLDRFGYGEADIANRVVDDRFRRLMQFEIGRARRLYQDGSAGLSALSNDGSRLTASAMAVIYSGILSAIEGQGYHVYRARAHLSAGQKLARLPRAWKLARAEIGDPVPEVFY